MFQNSELEVDKSQFRRSLIEVTEKPEESGRLSFIAMLDSHLRKGYQTYVPGKSHYDYNYTLNSHDALQKGENFVVIQFSVGSTGSKEYYRIVNQISVAEDNSISINRDEFKERFRN